MITNYHKLNIINEIKNLQETLKPQITNAEEETERNAIINTYNALTMLKAILDEE